MSEHEMLCEQADDAANQAPAKSPWGGWQWVCAVVAWVAFTASVNQGERAAGATDADTNEWTTVISEDELSEIEDRADDYLGIDEGPAAE